MQEPFECISQCAQCCIKRDYYPSKRFGKIGVLLLPGEVEDVKRHAGRVKTDVTILPRVAVSDGEGPRQVLAYQMMGRDPNGDTCPFLDTESDSRSPHGGYTCKIYSDRPLACRAYPLVGMDPVRIDESCKFCQECGQPGSNLDSESAALVRIRSHVRAGRSTVWRYATGVGEPQDGDIIETGWIRDEAD